MNRQEIMTIIDDMLLNKARELYIYVDFSDKQYDGDKNAPMDRIGFLDYLLNLIPPYTLLTGTTESNSTTVSNTEK